MTFVHPARRDALRHLALVGATLAAIVLILCTESLVAPGSAGAAAVNAGAAQIVTPSGGPGAGEPLATGGSATSFSLKLPAGAACAADGNNGGRWHTYMVPSTEDPASPAFAGNGALVGASIGSGGSGTFRNSIYNTSDNPVRGQAPNLGDAVIINIPNLRFSVWSAGNIPLGTYNVGIACVDLDLASARDSFWNAQLTIEADGTDPIGIRWVAVTTPTTTSTTSTTTGGSSTTTTTSGGSTTTTTDGSSTTSTSVTDSSTSSTFDDGTSTTGFAAVLGGEVESTTTGGGSSNLPATGASVAGFVVSAALLLVLGRSVVLLGRPIAVVEPD